jgi:hypothetical protein
MEKRRLKCLYKRVGFVQDYKCLGERCHPSGGAFWRWSNGKRNVVALKRGVDQLTTTKDPLVLSQNQSLGNPNAWRGDGPPWGMGIKKSN